MASFLWKLLSGASSREILCLLVMGLAFVAARRRTSASRGLLDDPIIIGMQSIAAEPSMELMAQTVNSHDLG
ncbi:hypothetical protein D9M71_628030 [compost metagenome]